MKVVQLHGAGSPGDKETPGSQRHAQAERQQRVVPDINTMMAALREFAQAERALLALGDNAGMEEEIAAEKRLSEATRMIRHLGEMIERNADLPDDCVSHQSLHGTLLLHSGNADGDGENAKPVFPRPVPGAPEDSASILMRAMQGRGSQPSATSCPRTGLPCINTDCTAGGCRFQRQRSPFG